MSVYTFEVGCGDEDAIRKLEHSAPLGAKDVVEAINKAKHVINSRSWRPESNLARLLEETGGHRRVVWTRPTVVARDL